jgi:6-phosphogluconolactonase (cycloisomerase 2 family)
VTVAVVWATAATAQAAPSVYVANSAADSVSQFGVGPAGRLTPLTPPAVSSSASPALVAAGPDGASLYVANFGAASVSQYDIAADGTLRTKAPPAVAAGGNPLGWP